MYDSKYFSLKEIQCHCGCGLYAPHEGFLMRLDAFRRELNRPIIPTSFCRCKKHNKAVGGSPMSKHLTGEAIDIMCHTVEKRGELVELAIKHGFKGIGLGDDLVHIDNRGGPLFIWLY